MRVKHLCAALGGAALLFGTALSTPAQAAGGGVELYHIWFDSPGKDTRTNASLNAEWVQLKNTSKKAVNVKGWVLKDASNHKYTFKNITVGPGKTVKIHTGSGKDTATDTFQNRKAYVWNNDGDTATLTKANGSKVDTCSWTKKTKDHKWC
ncbi:lamin tail domain-containing protein [Streptomyces acidiscabies]|uniref:lamin tail domain-containing protein n=1 Tax=Streptomyces acidiscabies TaxID=42234 RepID=UPI0038F64C03